VYITRLLGRREDEVTQMTRRLEERNRELDAFAARVAHDLKGPLAVLSFACDAIVRDGPNERTTSVFRRGVSRMDALIEDLLALSRVDVQTPGVACDPSKVASAVAEDWQARVAEAGGELEIDVEPASTPGSEGLLRQALSNLVDNGLKYRRSEVAPRIRVRGRRTTRDTYELDVADNGMGFSKDDVGGVFQPFHRGARSASKPGTGLGLSIVKRIVEARGGSVTVASTVDEGTTFTIVLRLANASLAVGEARSGVPAPSPQR
jgi:signal transduction histidine kinase